MIPTASTPSRIGHGIVAACAIIGLAIQTVIVAEYPADEIWWRAINMLSFFTILTNGVIAVTGIGIASGHGRLYRWAISPDTRGAVTVYILVVAIIFHLLLWNTIKPGPLHHWGNIICHQLVPALWVVMWLGFAPHGGIDRGAPVRWLIYPGLYGIWTLVHGAESLWYPYPFMNVEKFGWVLTVRNMALIGLFFVALGYLVRWIDARLARRAE